jgi:hypothetical protein
MVHTAAWIFGGDGPRGLWRTDIEQAASSREVGDKVKVEVKFSNLQSLCTREHVSQTRADFRKPTYGSSHRRLHKPYASHRTAARFHLRNLQQRSPTAYLLLPTYRPVRDGRHGWPCPLPGFKPEIRQTRVQWSMTARDLTLSATRTDKS